MKFEADIALMYPSGPQHKGNCKKRPRHPKHISVLTPEIDTTSPNPEAIIHLTQNPVNYSLKPVCGKVKAPTHTRDARARTAIKSYQEIYDRGYHLNLTQSANMICKNLPPGLLYSPPLPS